MIEIGTATVDRVEEQTFPVPVEAISTDPHYFEHSVRELPPGFLDPTSNTFQFSNHSWTIQVDGHVIVVDPCTGNGRRVGQAPVFDDLDTPYLERLTTAGAPPEQVDIVFCTHLHHDHCGWNVTRRDGAWVPTFPNATYYFADTEFDRWKPGNTHRHPNTFNPNVFDQCVQPVVSAGLARIVEPPYRLTPSLTLEHAPGHTLGHAILRLESDGAHAYFTGDAFHHPVQFSRPEWHLPGCDDLATATRTRRTLTRRLLDEDALVLPAHFPSPHYGRLTHEGNETRFRPGASD